MSTSALNAAERIVDDESDNLNSRIEQYRRSIMMLERSQSMAAARRSSNGRRSQRFARMSLQEQGDPYGPNWDSVGLGRVRHF